MDKQTPASESNTIIQSQKRTKTILTENFHEPSLGDIILLKIRMISI